jgi:hypothetical protein
MYSKSSLNAAPMNGQLYRTDSSLGTVLIRISLLRKSSLLNGHSVERTRTAIFPPLFENKAPLGGRGSSQSPSARASRLVLHASNFFELLFLVYDLLSLITCAIHM